MAKARRSSIARNGHTITLAQPYCTGQYCSGRWWLLAPPGGTVDVVAISPATSGSGTSARNGAEKNPAPAGTAQGFDGALWYTSYQSSRNVAIGVSASNPIRLSPGDRLWCSISPADPRSSQGGDPNLRKPLSSMEVFHCVSAVPADSAFAPGVCESSTNVRWYESDIDYNATAQLAPASGAADMNTLAASWFSRPWVDHITSVGGAVQGYGPSLNYPSYGADFSGLVGRALLLLNCNYTPAQKRQLMLGVVQAAIDIWSIAVNGGSQQWVGAGGHGQGRLPLIACVGKILDAPEMIQTVSQSTTAMRFSETDQTFLVPTNYPSLTDFISPSTGLSRSGDYTSSHVNPRIPEWGTEHTKQRRFDWANWGADYRGCCTGYARLGTVLSMLAMGLRSTIGTTEDRDCVFSYQDRYVRNHDPAGNGPGKTFPTSQRYYDIWQQLMWDAHRATYGNVWNGVNL